MRIVHMQKLSAPKEFSVPWNPAEEHDVLVDLRCSNCTQVFRDEVSLLQHWYVSRWNIRSSFIAVERYKDSQIIMSCISSLKSTKGASTSLSR